MKLETFQYLIRNELTEVFPNGLIAYYIWLSTALAIGVREGILLGVGRKRFALKTTIYPKNKQFALKLTF